MVDAIYCTNRLTTSMEGKTACEVFDVLKLADRYDIGVMVQEVKKILENFLLTEDNVLEVAGYVKKYSGIFEDEGQQLLLQCAKFLKSKFHDIRSVTTYLEENYLKKDIAVDLLVIMNKLFPRCSNCLQEPCKNGQRVEIGSFRVGLKVKRFKQNAEVVGASLRGCHARYNCSS